MRNRNQIARVMVTGLGAVTPLGLSVDAFWKGLVEGRSGIGPLTLCDPTAYPTRIAGELKGFDSQEFIPAKEARRMARFSQLAVAAALMAVEHAGLNVNLGGNHRMGVLLGNGNGGFPEIDATMRVLMARGGMKVSPFFFPMILPNMAAANVSRLLGARGYSSTISTACAASTQATGEAAEVIRRGHADVMITGGTEAGISQLGLAGFDVMRAMSTRNNEPERASRPFDAKRDGFVPSEGAGILVLESLEHAQARGAKVLAEVVGYAASADANHPVQPDADGAGASRAIRWALDDAKLEPNQVDYINAHGTSTPLNDSSETMAIKRVFGAFAYQVPISSTKSMIGHALGGAGGMEAVACVKTIQDNLIHPTINYENPDPACDLDYVPNKARHKKIKVVLSNSFGFGGQNACLVFKRFES
jgi:3-oxoacyl-[acyl-carrier-protein] synthase II